MSEHFDRKALGICTRCCRADAAPGRACCEDCLAADRRRSLARRRRAKATGSCETCGKPRGESTSSVRCQRCARRMAAASRQAWRRAKAELRCQGCRGEVDFYRGELGRKTCQDCADRYARDYQRRKQRRALAERLVAALRRGLDSAACGAYIYPTGRGNPADAATEKS